MYFVFLIIKWACKSNACSKLLLLDTREIITTTSGLLRVQNVIYYGNYPVQMLDQGRRGDL